MKISLNWIKDYIPGLQITSMDEFVEKMTDIGMDIESIENLGSKYEKLVVGKVLEKQKHPNADKLSICKVDAGTGSELQIVCGAPNVDAGQKVCVALEGAVIPNGGFTIKKSKIRGELSQGMICSEKELDLSESHEGILVLDSNAPIGESFASYMGLNDYIMDVWVPPNRGDLSSQIGMAREIASIFNLKVKLPEIKLNENAPETSSFIKVKIENEDCKRFTGRVIKNVKIAESPGWLKQRLLAIGLRPRNNIVDITNFVMMETGQPLHAFDYDRINGKEILVKSATEGDKFVTLDSKERTLNGNSLMICDAKGYSGIAGVMGGEHSEITGNTVNVFLESAYFDPVSIRKNSKKLGLLTDASQRFEKGVDINNVVYASNRASQLMQEIAGGEVSKSLLDIYPKPFENIIVGLRVKRTNDVTGLELSDKEIIDYLGRLEINYLAEKDGYLTFSIPEFRRYDIQREIDLIEETARMYGLSNLPTETITAIDISDRKIKGMPAGSINKVKEYFIGRGFHEILTRSQQEEKLIKHFSNHYIKVENPYSSELNVMRVNLLYGMLNVIKNNYNSSGRDISMKLFEIGRVFEGVNGTTETIKESRHICFAMTGKRDFYAYDGKSTDFDIFDLKGELEMFFLKLNLENIGLFYYNSDVSGSDSSIGIRINNCEIGKLQRVNKETLEIFDIDANIYTCELDLDALLSHQKGSVHYNEISKFPNVKRDLALVVNSTDSFDSVRNMIIKAGGKMLKDVRLFDIYTGEKVGAGKKSLAFSLEFASTAKTLTDDEVNLQVDKIVKSLEKEIGAALRS